MAKDDDAGHVIARHRAAGHQRGPAQGRRGLVARRLAAVAERLGDVDPADLLGAGEVGDGSGDAQHAVEAARRQAHRRRRVGEQLAPRLVGRRDPVEQFAVGLGVGARRPCRCSARPGPARAAATRRATSALPSAGGGKVRSAADTPGTST